MSLLVAENVSKAYPAGLREEVVMHRVSLRIELGDFIGVWGPRRSGKSTLLRILAGMQRPESGSVYFDGRDMTGISADTHAMLLRSGGIALVSESRVERNTRTVDYVARPLLCEDLSRRQARSSAHKALERVGISPCAELGLQRLSPGELFRVELAMALMRSPRLLLVDEPGILSSPIEGQELYGLLRELGNDSLLALVVASADVDALRGVKRKFAIGGGRLRDHTEAGVVVPFSRRASL